MELGPALKPRVMPPTIKVTVRRVTVRLHAQRSPKPQAGYGEDEEHIGIDLKFTTGATETGTRRGARSNEHREECGDTQEKMV